MSYISLWVQLLEGQLTNAGIDINPYQDLLDDIGKSAAKVSDLLATFSRFTLNNENSQEVVDMDEVIYD
jgi:hypothetical protein